MIQQDDKISIDEPISMFDELMSRGERLRQLRLLAQADEEEREQQRRREKEQRRLKQRQMKKEKMVVQGQAQSHQQQKQQQIDVITNDSMNLIIEGEEDAAAITTSTSTITSAFSSTSLYQKLSQQQQNLAESAFTNSTSNSTNSCTTSNGDGDRNGFEFIEEGDYHPMGSELVNDYIDDNDVEDDSGDSEEEEDVDKIDILPDSKLRVLRYDSYISHQRYNDDYKHANCHFVDFGNITKPAVVIGNTEAETQAQAQSNGNIYQGFAETVEEEGWDCLCLSSSPTVDSENRLIIQQEKQLGKGGLVWDAGVILAEHLLATQEKWMKKKKEILGGDITGLDNKYDNKMTKIVELGGGTGVTGMMLAKAVPSSHVYVTDLPDLLFLMQSNVERNFHPDCIIDDGKLTQQDILNMDRGEAAREIPGVLKRFSNNTSTNNTSSLQLSNADLNALYNDDTGIVQNCNDNDITSTTSELMKRSAGNIAARVLRWGMKEDYQDGPFDVIIAGDVITSLYDPQALAETLYDLCHDESIVYVSFKRRLSEVHVRFERIMQDLFETIDFVDPLTRHRNLEEICIMVLKDKKKDFPKLT